MTSRKHDQVQEREAGILRVAGKILATQGWNALTMDSVLARVAFSKGTLYNHFSCRQDLMVAFHTRCLVNYLGYFERGALFHGRPRERLVAAVLGYELKAALDPDPFQFSLAGDILAAASGQRRQAFLAAQQDTFRVFVGIARDGIANGDLRSTHSPDFVALSTWATGVGAEHLPVKDLADWLVPDPEFLALRRRMVFALLDGLGWQPLSSTHDYEAVRQRALQEVFAPEAEQLGLLPKTPRNRARSHPVMGP